MRIFSRTFWFDLMHRVMARIGLPRRMPLDVEARLEAARRMREADGVSILQLDVWSEGPNPCKAHCWHVVRSSNSHRSAVGSWKEHIDYICCQCTHGLCHVSAGPGPVVSHPIPRQHARIRQR